MKGIEECPVSGYKMVKNFDKAVHHFHSHNTGQVLKGFKYILLVVKEAPGELASCEGIKDSISKAVSMVLAIVNPAQIVKILGKNVIVKGPKIIKYVHKGIKAEKKHDMYHFGFYIGLALNKLIG